MIYREFGKTGWNVSAIGTGTWNIGNEWGDIDDATAWATVRAAFDAGVNLFDTAESYGIPHGLSELRLGQALSGIRHRIYLVSKIGFWGVRSGGVVPKNSVDMIRLCAYACMGRLGTDWIDVMLCHVADIKDPDIFLEGFDSLRKEGRIRAYGISTNDLDVLKRFNAEGNCDVVQVDYSLLNREPEDEFIPYCQENGVAILVRGPLARGLLSGEYSKESIYVGQIRKPWNDDPDARADVHKKLEKVERLKQIVAPGKEIVSAALRFVISHPAQPVAIPGSKTPEQARMNAAAGDKILTEQEIAKLTNVMGE